MSHKNIFPTLSLIFLTLFSYIKCIYHFYYMWVFRYANVKSKNTSGASKTKNSEKLNISDITFLILISFHLIIPGEKNVPKIVFF